VLTARRLFLGAVALGIFWLSSKPSLEPPFILFAHQDKVFHFLEFAGLGFALHLNRDMWRNRPFLWSSLSGLCCAALDEVHQHYVPGRYCDILDFSADAAGLLTSLALFRYLSTIGKFRPGTDPPEKRMEENQA
jgi:VanZ family protein